MRRTIPPLILIFLPLIIIGQNSESYFPIKFGKEKMLTWYKGKYLESFTDSTELGGEKYYLYSQKFSNNSMGIYIRISNDTVYHWNDVKKKHQAFFGVNPKVGETIGNGTIKKVGGKLKTPKGEFLNLLVIEMNYPNGESGTRYYQKGLGLVAVKSNNELISYYVPD